MKDKSEDWIQLKWFPRCNIQTKRNYIKALLKDLSKLDKQEVIANYKEKRKNLFEEYKDQPNQFDEIDMEEFEDYIDDLVENEDEYP